MGRHVEQMRAPRGTAAHLHGQFHVVVAIANARRFATRYQLYNDFREYIERAGATLWTVECAYGNRAHAITDAADPHHIQLRTKHELFHKENLLNIAISRLPSDWRYVAWIDPDVTFARPDWLNSTVQALQHHMVVQMWSEALDLSPAYEVLGRHESFCRSIALKRPRKAFNSHPYYGLAAQPGGINTHHPGYAWAARREALDHLGGLPDFGILGAADNHLANILVGTADRSIHPQAHPNYRKWVHRWQARAERHIHRDIGCVEGTLLHQYHGAKNRRGYWSRWNILVENQFDPETDLIRDVTGLWQLNEPRSARHRNLRDGIRHYFASRREDDVCQDHL